jgi:hypothetical protein
MASGVGVRELREANEDKLDLTSRSGGGHGAGRAFG